MADCLYVARHGETTYNLARRVNGDPSADVALTPAGLEQAERLRHQLDSIVLDVVVTTEFTRTVHTAEVVARGREVKHVTMRELNDPLLGALEGADFDAYRAWRDAHGIEDRIPGGGESQVDAVERYALGWARVLEMAGNVLVVAHAFPISFALTLAEERPPYLRARYERSVEQAVLHEIGVAGLAASLLAVTSELDALRRQGH